MTEREFVPSRPSECRIAYDRRERRLGRAMAEYGLSLLRKGQVEAVESDAAFTGRLNDENIPLPATNAKALADALELQAHAKQCGGCRHRGSCLVYPELQNISVAAHEYGQRHRRAERYAKYRAQAK